MTAPILQGFCETWQVQCLLGTLNTQLTLLLVLFPHQPC